MSTPSVDSSSGLSSQTTLLDHAAFPHIIHRILQYAPSDSLLVWRSTSRKNKDDADRLLWSHIYYPVPGNGLAALPYARDPVGDGFSSPFSCHRLPLDQCYAYPRYPCVLDVDRAPIEWRGYQTVLSPVLRETAHTFRRRLGRCSWGDPELGLDSAEIPQSATKVVTIHGWRRDVTFTWPPELLHEKLTAWVVTLLISLECEPQRPASTYYGPCPIYHPPTLTTVTFIIRNVTDDQNPREYQQSVWSYIIKQGAILLHTLVAYPNYETKYTLVWDASPNNRDCTGKTEHEAVLEQLFRQLSATLLARIVGQEHRLRTLSVNDYRAEVGEAQFALETQE